MRHRSPRSQLSAPPCAPYPSIPQILSSTGSPSTPNTPAMQAVFRLREVACAAGSHLTPLVLWQTDGIHFPHLDPPQKTTTTPAAFPRQHAEAGQEAEGKNDTNDAHADDRRVVRRQHGRQRRGRATAPGTRDVTREISSSTIISGRRAAVEVIPWLRKGIARAGARVFIPTADLPNGAARGATASGKWGAVSLPATPTKNVSRRHTTATAAQFPHAARVVGTCRVVVAAI